MGKRTDPLALVRRKRRAAGMRIHLLRAFKRGARREQIAEALTFTLLHCGGPTMLAAMDCWLKMVNQGKIPAPFATKPSKVRATERKKA